MILKVELYKLCFLLMLKGMITNEKDWYIVVFFNRSFLLFVFIVIHGEMKISGILIHHS